MIEFVLWNGDVLTGIPALLAAFTLFIVVPIAYLSWVLIGFNREARKNGLPPIEF